MLHDPWNIEDFKLTEKVQIHYKSKFIFKFLDYINLGNTNVQLEIFVLRINSKLSYYRVIHNSSLNIIPDHYIL